MAFFGLLSHLDKTKWHDSPTSAPENKKSMAGGTYAPYGVINAVVKDNYIEFFLSHNNGTQRQGLLYSARSNPLRDVGHCWFSFREDSVITGVCIEDDWVVINDDYLSTIPIHVAEKEQAELKRAETIDMGIYGDLVHDKWDKKEKAPRGKGKLGYHKYEILRSEQSGENEFTVYLCSDPQGVQSSAKICEAQRNPFRQILNCFLKIAAENGSNIIKGVMVEQDWVEMYN